MEYYLEEQHCAGFYDKLKRIVCVVFRGSIAPETLLTAQNWLSTIKHPIIGILVDVRQVTRFPQDLWISKDEIHEVYVVGNPYQQTSLQLQFARNPKQLVVPSHEAAMIYFENAIPKDSSENLLVLNSEGASVFYDSEKRLAYMTYYGTVTPNVTATVYETLGKLTEHFDLRDSRGGIWDFRLVAGFDNSNYTAVQRTSGKLNLSHDLSHVPTALVVSSVMQERMLLVSMKLTPQEKRKRIVHGFVDAWNFIDKFHQDKVHTVT